ncbi:hypothetical protein DFH05DRAFT_1522796 [Lentinula detonsa]|uniref:Myb/SANT-like domain-containing protein n=1 Tax=Lentinula detonsa TaxID=2804962 RepID=A0A9W8P3H8_9AGAR|nr:hypothetical protein DFH05DRAFT_1522796 [Lentinula detonsa]
MASTPNAPATRAPPSQQLKTAASKPKTHWTTDSDRALLGCLKESKHAGFQTDNGGFHADAFKAAAARIEEESKELDDSEKIGTAKTSESCRTRFTTLKKEYKEVKYLRNLSGFGWNPLQHVVTATPSVWSSLLTASPKYAKWQRKSFFFFDEMAELVDGHVATGATAFHPSAPAPQPVPIQDEAEADDEQTDDGEDLAMDMNLARSSQSTITQASQSPRTPVQSSQASSTVSRSHSRKSNQSNAGLEIADALRDLADSAKGDISDPNSRTPSRKSRAIRTIEEDGELSDNSMTQAFQLISRNVSVADTYLAISDVSRRTRYLSAELFSSN